jgi:hypothetical protein
MSNQPIDPKVGLMVSAADHLIPLFKTDAIDAPLAREIAISAIAAYGPESRADYLSVARTIAFSMAALALLGKAASSDMPLPEQMRAYGRANALNRSADQSERTMMKRRSFQKANPPAEPDAPIEDAEIHAVVAEATRDKPTVTAKAAAPAQSPATATRPKLNAIFAQPGQPQKSSYKAALLQNSAIPPHIAQSATG